MNETTKLRFPPQRSLLSMFGKSGVALLFAGAGTAVVVTTLWGMPIQWSDGEPLPAWGSILIGLVFAAVGGVMLSRREHAVIHRRYGWVKGWPDLIATFRRRLPLSAFEAVRLETWPTDAPESEGYTLWLTGPEHALLLETFDPEQAAEAIERAKRTGGHLDLPINLAPSLEEQTDTS